MKRKLILLSLLVYSFCALQPSSLTAADNSGVLVRGKNFLFHVKAPKGWVMDTENGAAKGFEVLLYPENDKSEESKAVMHVQVILKSDFETDSIHDPIEYYKYDTRERIPYVEFASLDPVKTKGKRSAKIVKTIYRRVDATGFVNETELVVLIVLSSLNEEEFQKAYPAYVEFIQSYKFIAALHNVPE